MALGLDGWELGMGEMNKKDSRTAHTVNRQWAVLETTLWALLLTKKAAGREGCTPPPYGKEEEETPYTPVSALASTP